jgi:hypothetical protein
MEESHMSIAKLSFATILATVLMTGSTWVATEVPGLDSGIKAFAASKGQARQSLDQVMRSLREVDTAYASGNAAEAQSRFDEARAAWNNVSSVISAREAREAQLMFDSLGGQLKSGAPATQVRSTISGMLEELREDIGRELGERRGERR